MKLITNESLVSPCIGETIIETPIKKVYLAQIKYPFENGDFTPIGVYSSRENAQNAIDKKIDSSTYDKSMLSSDIDEYILDQE